MNRDFSDMLAALSAAGARYLMVGAHALAAHGLPRATGDLDIWIEPTPGNAERVWQGLNAFGAPLAALSESDLASDGLVYQIGIAPVRIDLLTSITGVSFAEAWPARLFVDSGDLRIPVIGRSHLIRNKRATGRPQDVVDADRLEAAE